MTCEMAAKNKDNKPQQKKCNQLIFQRSSSQTANTYQDSASQVSWNNQI